MFEYTNQAILDTMRELKKRTGWGVPVVSYAEDGLRLLVASLSEDGQCHQSVSVSIGCMTAWDGVSWDDNVNILHQIPIKEYPVYTDPPLEFKRDEALYGAHDPEVGF